MKIKKIIVDEIPQNCGCCFLCEYINGKPRCLVVDREVWEIRGNPYNMKYRRSDCPLQIEKDSRWRFYYDL